MEIDPVKLSSVTEGSISHFTTEWAIPFSFPLLLSILPFLADFSEAWAARPTMDSEPLFCAMASTGMVKAVVYRLHELAAVSRGSHLVGPCNPGPYVL